MDDLVLVIFTLLYFKAALLYPGKREHFLKQATALAFQCQPGNMNSIIKSIYAFLSFESGNLSECAATLRELNYGETKLAIVAAVATCSTQEFLDKVI